MDPGPNATGHQLPPSTPIGRSTACLGCGADRTGLAPQDPCPYCGTIPAIDVSAAWPDAGIEPGKCVACGYDLSGLASNGRCPECGLEIRHSQAGPLLRHASPEFVRALHLGAILAEWWAVIGVVIWLPFFWGMVVQGKPAEVASSVMSLAAAAFGLAGWWLLTIPDPTCDRHLPPESTRRRLRIALVVLVAATIADHAITLTGLAQRQFFGVRAMGGFGAISLVKSAAGVAFYFLAMSHLRWLARRAADVLLWRDTRSFRWLIALFFIPGILVCGIGPFVGMILFAVLLGQSRRRFKAVRREVDARAA